MQIGLLTDSLSELTRAEALDTAVREALESHLATALERTR